MRKFNVIILLILILLLPAADIQAGINLETRVHNNLLNLQDVLDLSRGKRIKIQSNEQIGLDYVNRQEISFGHGFPVIGYIRYQEGNYNLAGESVQFLIDNYLEMFYRYSYKLEAETKRQELDGFFFRKDLKNLLSDGWQGNVQVNLFRGQTLEGRDYSAETVFDREEENYIMNGRRMRVNSSRGQDRENINFRGQGIGFDLFLKKDLDKERSVRFSADNLYSFIKWSDVYTRILEDKEEGFYYFHDYNTQLQPFYQLDLQDGNHILGAAYHWDKLHFRFLRILELGTHKFITGIENTFFKFKWEKGNWQAQISTPGIFPQSIKGIGLGFSYQFNF